ncbi:hypothetical protein AC579_3418 [Pseudocercospora musae]|uniref:chitinase n=1 Tax=Pseudocercospora musae TaxID=113226 RepID=A0A139GT82_9PEZI|nr:hypothetical protein AC579_3418 [Pseudocercospora musae]
MRTPLALSALLGVAFSLPAELFIDPRAASDPYNPPRVLAYVQTFKRYQDTNQFSLLPMISNPTQVTHIYLSSLHINSDPSAITLNDNNPNSSVFSTVWQEAAQLQSKGVKVLYMMGGAAAGSYPRLCSGPSSTIVASNIFGNETYYKALYYELKYHKLDGIDLDIEEKVAYTCPLALLQRLAKDFGTNFITTMSPVASELQPSGYGLGGFSYKTLDSQATSSTKPNGKLINWFNPQFYNGWGDASNPNGYNAIVKNGYAANRVAFNMLAAQNDGGSGWKPITTYQNVVATLKANYGSKFGGTNGWEYWDAGRNDNMSEPWKWVGTLGNSVYGTSYNMAKRDADESYSELEERQVAQDFNSTITLGDSPWPALTNQLKILGVVQLAAVRALNISNGNLAQALQILGLPPL